MKIEGPAKTKVAIVIRNFTSSGGGAEKYCFKTVEKLKEKYDTYVITQNIYSEINGVTFFHIRQKIKKPRFINQLIFSNEVYKIIKKNNFDLVHSHDIVNHANVYSVHVPCFKSFISSSYGIDKILKIFGVLISPRKLAYLWLESKVFKKKSLKKLIMPVSYQLLRNISENYQINENYRIAYPGIDKVSSKKRKSIRQEYGLKQSDFVILFVGHGFRRKGLHKIIEALEIIDNEKISCIVIGNGRQSEVSFAKDSVKNKVFFLGEVNNMSEFYQSANVLIHPTSGDTFGMVVLEAMSNKIPVIVSNKNYCGICETLSDKEVIFLENQNDVDGIIGGIKKIMTQADFVKKMVEKAKVKSNQLNWDSTINEIEQAYEQILKINYEK